MNQTGLFSAVWYRRELDAPAIPDGERLLRFGAADHHTTVWLDDIKVGEHVGGYTPFSFDITELLRAGRRSLTVRARAGARDVCMVPARRLRLEQARDAGRGRLRLRVFDVRCTPPRPTALFAPVRSLATTGDLRHHVLSRHGWWRWRMGDVT